MSLRMGLIAGALAMALSACERQAPGTDAAADNAAPASGASPSQTPEPVATPDITDLPPVPLDAALVRQEWEKAQNKDACAPLAFTSLGGADATARRANFSGGWAIAYDQAGQRSAFGLAGTGLNEGDDAPPPEQRARLARQWPLFRDLEKLEWPSFAGYGVEGADRYPSNNPDGDGLNSLAYLRVGGQQCTYNVWSRLGRAHLEHLLEHLTVITN